MSEDSTRRLRRRSLLALSLLVVGLTAAVVWLRARQQVETLSRGAVVVNLPVTTLDGRPTILRASGGPRSWLVVRPECAFCLAELRSIAANGSTRSANDVIVLSLGGLEATRAMAHRLLPETGPPVLVDQQGLLERRYGRFYVPTILRLDHEGRVVAKRRGRFEIAADADRTHAEVVP